MRMVFPLILDDVMERTLPQASRLVFRPSYTNKPRQTIDDIIDPQTGLPI